MALSSLGTQERFDFPLSNLFEKERPMSKSSTVAVFDTIAQAEEGVRELTDKGIAAENISLIAKDMQCEKQVHGFVTSCDVAKQVAGNSAWFGGLCGVLVGGAFLWIPGVGPLVVAGSLTSALLGGIEGAVGGAALGGVLGWLSALGIGKQHIVKYEDHIKAGKYLLFVHGSKEEADKSQRILSGIENKEIHRHNGEAAA
jgi:uncharacterized membrane protein